MQVAACDLRAAFPAAELTLVAFGSPRCGSVPFAAVVAAAVRGRVFYVHTCGSAAPYTPPMLLGYAHAPGAQLALERGHGVRVFAGRAAWRRQSPNCAAWPWQVCASAVQFLLGRLRGVRVAAESLEYLLRLERHMP